MGIPITQYLSAGTRRRFKLWLIILVAWDIIAWIGDFDGWRAVILNIVIAALWATDAIWDISTYRRRKNQEPQEEDANSSLDLDPGGDLLSVPCMQMDVSKGKPANEIHDIVGDNTGAVTDTMDTEVVGTVADIASDAADGAVEAIGEIASEALNAIGEMVSGSTDN